MTPDVGIAWLLEDGEPMGAKRKRKKEQAAELNRSGNDLRPGDLDQARPCAIEDIRARCEGSHPGFLEDVDAFISKYREGDVVEEYCSSIQSWREGMGLSGFRLSRNGAEIAFLRLRFN